MPIIEGTLADIDGVRHGQIAIDHGVITAVGANLGPATHVFGDNCLIFAGMGDIHIHAREDVSQKDIHKETFACASAAALNGGVLHVADMPNNPAAPIDDASYATKEALLQKQNLPVGFTLYAGIGPGTRPLKRVVPYKAYMGPSVGDLFFSTLEQLEETLAHYAGQAVSFHCEDPVLLEKHKGAATHEERRPAECEFSATLFALKMIEKYRLQGKLCHYSVGQGLAMIAAAKRKGLAVTAEATPHHVFFDTEQITPANRAWMQMNPPLRKPWDREAMLEALRDGTADYLATDHAPHTLAEKERGISGQPHLDTYGPFVTWLIVEKGFTPQRIAAICSANPGTFVNPYQSEKWGRLLPGYIGSLTVLDLKKPITIRREMLRTKCGWSPFEGMTFPGSVAAVFVRGERLRNPT
ncbi:MAG: amidohydrolase family protein [Planctomycetes bacterium]|nr:amidohydrolase family protein [Planctomycetota bacterium]